MPKNDEMNDINELLSGLGDELTQPAQESPNDIPSDPKKQNETNNLSQSEANESSEDKIEELLTGLDANPFSQPDKVLDIIDNKMPVSQISESVPDTPVQTNEPITPTTTEPPKTDSSHDTGLEDLDDLTLSQPAEEPHYTGLEDLDNLTLSQPTEEPHDTGLGDLDDLTLSQPAEEPHDTGLDDLDNLTLSQPTEEPHDTGLDDLDDLTLSQPTEEPHDTGLGDLDDLTLSQPAEEPHDTGLDDLDNLTLSQPTEEPNTTTDSDSQESDVVAAEELPSLDELGDLQLDDLSPEDTTETPSKNVSEPKISKQKTDKPVKQDKTKPLDLSEAELKFITKRIEHFGPDLQTKVKQIIFEESLPQKDINSLLNLILKKKSVKKIKEFIENKTKTKIKSPLLDPDYVRILKEKKGVKTKQPKIKSHRKTPPLSQKLNEHILPVLRVILLFSAIIGGLGALVWFVTPRLMAPVKIKQGMKLIQTKQIGNIKQAEILFNKALKDRPKFFQAYLLYSAKYIDIGLYDKANIKLTQYYQLKGETFEYNILKGKLHEARGLYNQALTSYNQALKQKPEDFKAVNRIGQLYMKLNKIQTAKEIYSKYIEKHANNLDAQYRLMQIFIRLKDIEKAENKFAEILHKNNKYINAEVVTELGQFYINMSTKTAKAAKQQFLNRANVVLQLVVAKHKKYAPAYYEIARLEMKRHGLVTARRALEKAVHYDKEQPQYYTLLGKIYYQQKDIKNAIINYKKAIKVNFNYMPSHYYLAHLSYYDQKNYGKAEKEYSQAKILYNSSSDNDKDGLDINEMNYNLARLKYKKGDYDEALRIWSDFYQNYPDNPAFLLGTGNAYLHIQRYDLAKKQFQNGIDKLKSLMQEKGIVEPDRNFDQALYKQLSAMYNNLGLSFHFLHNDKKALVNLWQSIEAIKTIGYFNENEKANVNIQLILHPTKNSDGRLLVDESVPYDYKLPEY